MKVDLNTVAAKIVPDYQHKQFVDSVMDIDLPPLYRGPTKVFYPNRLSSDVFHKNKILRYVFKYNSNGTFDFLAARMGQRNGGNDVKLQDSAINISITDPADNFSVLDAENFTPVNDSIWRFGDSKRIVYVNGRYEWQEKQIGDLVFSVKYFCEPTDKDLFEADKEGDVNWFEEATPPRYVVAANSRVVYYNNNTLKGLNSWPIQNANAQVQQGFITNEYYGTDLGGMVNEVRPEPLTNSYLNRCFQNIPLQSYDTVFVEIIWNAYTNINEGWRETYGPNPDRPIWLGQSFEVPVVKGRVYRIGKLHKDSGVGGYDVVTFAQRTRIRTTTNKRGGNNIYE